MNKLDLEGYISKGKERGLSWYIIFFLVVVLMLIFSWFQKNFLFMFVILLGSILILTGNKDEKIKCSIDENGFYVGENKENFYNYKEDIEGFSVLEGQGGDVLVFHLRKLLRGYIKIYLPRGKGGEIKKLLSGKVKEEKYEEGVMESLLELFKI
jgi:hypothetical protein